MRIILAALLVIATSQGAAAYCLAQPDNANSAYVVNGLNQSLCLGGELSSNTAARNRAVEIDATLGNLQRHLLQQKFDNTIRQPAFNHLNASPSWP